MLRIVETENGMVKGLPAADPRITSFKGIPFAAPPIGENRWRAPQKPNNWDGIFKAYEFAPISMQAVLGIDKNDIYAREWHVDPDIPMNEDCLYLNVWTPANNSNENLPVFVWFFGGGLQVGNTAEMEFDGERLARRGIIVVTVNYRLNAFGFLCHPEITTESPDTPGNFGHLDQQAGIKWVKNNIRAFGGDPENITIGGQSAGGGSVISHIVSPQSENLFNRAIIQSGIISQVYPGNRIPFIQEDFKAAEEYGKEFFNFLGVKNLSEARSLNAEYLQEKSLEFQGFWGTVVDGKYCIGNPFSLLINNNFNNIPLIIGNTADEFFSVPVANTHEEFATVAEELFGEKADEFLELCDYKTKSMDELKNLVQVNSIEYSARLLGKSYELNNVKTPMYYYNFNTDIPGWDNPGNFHSVDLWFSFETLAKCWRPFVGKHYDLSRKMCNYWTNFIKNGNPNGLDIDGTNMPVWEPYKHNEPYGMEFGDTAEFVKQDPNDIVKFLIANKLPKK